MRFIIAAPVALIAALALGACGAPPADDAAEETATESMAPPPPPEVAAASPAEDADTAAAPPGAEPDLDRGLPVCPGDPRCKKK